MAFDGDGDHLASGPVATDTLDSRGRVERTISAWVSIDPDRNDAQCLVVTDSDILNLFIDADGLLVATCSFADGHQEQLRDTEPLPSDRWVHVTAMVDYDGDVDGRTTLRLLRNGVESISTSIEPFKPLHLAMKNLYLRQTAIPVTTVNYDTASTRQRHGRGMDQTGWQRARGHRQLAPRQQRRVSH